MELTDWSYQNANLGASVPHYGIAAWLQDLANFGAK
jgi:hypothetical protein